MRKFVVVMPWVDQVSNQAHAHSEVVEAPDKGTVIEALHRIVSDEDAWVQFARERYGYHEEERDWIVDSAPSVETTFVIAIDEIEREAMTIGQFLKRAGLADQFTT